MIVIYTPKVTNRIKYTLDFIFTGYFGIPYELIQDPGIRQAPENIYINYSSQKIPGFFSIYRDDLLLQETITAQHIFVSREHQMPVFFQTTEHFDLRFDIFSCIFYLLSRYEEYLPHETDIHGRYKSSNSILSRPEFNFSPVIEVWLHHFKTELLKINPAIPFRKYAFEYLPTFDVDNAYKYKGRNWLKRPPNIFKRECRNTFFGHKDPYDTFDFILGEAEKYELKPLFFFLLSDENENDSNVSPVSLQLYELLRRVSDAKINIGIHPSYCAGSDHTIAEEKKHLEVLSSSSISISRQHFLRINFKGYFSELNDAGIKKDYSLAYPDTIGFRAGFSREFSFFDLRENKITDLIFQPSGWMDATYEYYQTKNYLKMTQEILQFIRQIRKINGKLVTIFHNDLIAKEDYRNAFQFINNHVNVDYEE
ncbi:MAG: hypothetical protein JWN78_2544 [Bacteroidota bacterium]|nr:hypothetical protein [Bacteroidota bacterium]